MRARNDADFDMDPNAGPDSESDSTAPARHDGRGSTSRLPPAQRT